MNMYLGTILMTSGFYMTRRFIQLDAIFDSIAAIDMEIEKLLGTKSQIHSIKRKQNRDEAIWIIAFTISTASITIYDVTMLYPP